MTEENKTKKPTKGAWGSISEERKPNIKWEKTNEEHIVTFGKDFIEPREIEFEENVFYVFPCWENGEEREIATSAWSLLRALKLEQPLAGKTFRITKTMVKGKQVYIVVPIEKVVEEKVR